MCWDNNNDSNCSNCEWFEEEDWEVGISGGCCHESLYNEDEWTINPVKETEFMKYMEDNICPFKETKSTPQ